MHTLPNLVTQGKLHCPFLFVYILWAKCLPVPLVSFLLPKDEKETNLSEVSEED